MKKKRLSNPVGERRDGLARPSASELSKGTRRLRGALWAFALVAAWCTLVPGPRALLAKKKPPPSRTIMGQVLDKAENPIPDAAVELTDKQTGKKIAIYSQEDGSYQFTDLRLDHDYEVQAIYKNEKSDVRRVASVEPRNQVVINLQIPPDNP